MMRKRPTSRHAKRMMVTLSKYKLSIKVTTGVGQPIRRRAPKIKGCAIATNAFSWSINTAAAATPRCALNDLATVSTSRMLSVVSLP